METTGTFFGLREAQAPNPARFDCTCALIWALLYPKPKPYSSTEAPTQKSPSNALILILMVVGLRFIDKNLIHALSKTQTNL